MAAQKPIELILTRHLAATLATPVFLVDADGTLVFYNEPAEQVLGVRFEETGEMPASEWATAWAPTDRNGVPLPPERVPLSVAITERRPAHGALMIRGLDGKRRSIEATAIPLVRCGGEVVGAVALFWETSP
jgi:PAS domain-containing protein